MDAGNLSHSTALLLLRHWKLLLGVPFLAGAVTYAFNAYLLKPEYTATVSLMMGNIRVDLGFDPKARVPAEGAPDQPLRFRSTEAMAFSDQVLLKVAAKLHPGSTEVPSELRNGLKIGVVGDLILFSATTKDPARSAEVANAWAATVCEASEAFAGRNPETMSRMVASKNKSHEEYRKANALLLEFEREENRTQVLESKQADYREYLRELERSIRRAKACLQDLRRYTTDSNGPGALDLSRTVAFALIEISSLQSMLNLRTPLPVQVPVAVFPSSAGAPPPRLEEVKRLAAQLEAKLAESEALLAKEREGVEIMKLQADLEALAMKKKELTAARDLAWESHLTFARKVEEIHFTGQTDPDRLVIVSRATPSLQPDRRSDVYNSIVATILALIAVLAYLWLKPLRQAAQGLAAS